MKSFINVLSVVFAVLLAASVVAHAHTTVIFPVKGENGKKALKVVHFTPWSGDNIMGIRLGAEDTPLLKGIRSVSLVHRGEEEEISSLCVPGMFRVKDAARECYTIPLSHRLMPHAGDYVFVVRHIYHWKRHLGRYVMKVAKFFINQGGLVTDWPRRLLADAPEIIPLSPPYAAHAGTIFRAEAVNERGETLPHAKIHVEFLNYPYDHSGLVLSGPIIHNQDVGECVIYADRSGAFSFVPPAAGVWTFTLVDGDSGFRREGRDVQYDSSLSIVVKPAVK